MAQLHSLLTANHRPYAGVYADSAERLAATGFVRQLGGGVVAFTADDLYKKVLQLDNATEWVLTAITPTWVQVSGAGSLANDSITNSLLANMATQTIKGRTTAGTGDPEDLTATQATAILNAMVGDSGSGGTKGLVPAPGAGDAAANKFLKADGTFAVPAGGVGGLGDVVGPASATDNALARFDTTTGKLIQNSAVSIDDDGAITIPEIAAPGTPAAGKIVLYGKADNKIYRKGEDGVEAELGAGSPTFPLLAPDGTQGAPSYSFTNSADTGWYLLNGTPDHLRAGVGNKEFLDMYQSAVAQPTILMSLNSVTRLGWGNSTLSAGFYSPRTGHVAVISSEASTPTSATLYSPTADATTVGGNEILVDLDLGNVRKYTLPANRTVRDPSNLRDGDILTFIVMQDGTGGWAITSWTSKWKFAGGAAPTITTAANSVDIFRFWSNGTNLYELSRSMDVK